MFRVIILRKSRTLILALGAVIATLCLVIFPKEGLQAAEEGLKVFWEIVLPSLLPFFVLSEILLGLGVVHFLGVLLEPLMRPVFNVPGVGAFALSMGLAAGYPMDAVITAKFRRNGLCTRVEGERLLAFTNTADPLFMFGAVAVGMFGRPELGVIIAVAHYLSSFSVGFIFRFYNPSDKLKVSERAMRQEGTILRRAVRALFAARREDGRPVGQILGDAVKESMTTIFMIGGFIMLFSVFVRILNVTGVMGAIFPMVGGVLKLFGLRPELSGAFMAGFLEIDLGCIAAARAAAPLAQRLILASAIIAWSGLSVHAQVASVVYGSDIRMTPYMVARVLHAIFAGAYTYLLLGPLASLANAEGSAVTYGPVKGLERMILSGKHLLFIVGVLLVMALLNYLRQRYALIVSPPRRAKKLNG